MSTSHDHSGPEEIRLPLHDDVAYEKSDVSTGPILKFLFWLGVAVFLSFVVSLGIYKGLKAYWLDTYPPSPPSAAIVGPQLPPEPRLQPMVGHQVDPQQDWRNMQELDMKANDRLRWIDEKTGLAQIPVTDAMQVIAEKGLPSGYGQGVEKKQ